MSTHLTLHESVLPLQATGAPPENHPGEEKVTHLRGTAWSITLLAWLIRGCAVINLISSLLPEKPKVAHWFATWMPFEISEGIRFRMFLTAVLLLILAGGLKKGKKTAWLLTMGTLAVAPFSHLGQMPVLPQLLINSGLILFLLLHHRHFVVKSDRRSVRSAIIISSFLTVALVTFGTVRLHHLVNQTSGGNDWGSCLQTAFELVLTHHAHAQQPETVGSSQFFTVLRVGSTTIALVGLFLVLRPVLERRTLHAHDRAKARRLIDAYGDDPFDAYALLDDKSFFFGAEGRAVIPYVRSGNFAVALADPIGHRAFRAAAIIDFTLFCRRQDWEPVFYVVKSDQASSYKNAGYSLFKIGEGTSLRADRFQLKGQEFQNLRTLRNRAQRLGITFRWYDAAGGIDHQLEHQLAHISDRWLEMKNAREMSFDMGAFSLADIRHNGAAVALDPEGKALAFATWRPFAQGGGRALDLMRCLPEERNIVDFVLVESIFHFNALGITHLDLGLAPLANTEQSPSRLVTEDKMVQLLFENLNHLYGYKSLFEFKRKYRPEWCGRYVAYKRGVHLPLVGLALLRVHAPAGLWKFFFP